MNSTNRIARLFGKRPLQLTILAAAMTGVLATATAASFSTSAQTDAEVVPELLAQHTAQRYSVSTQTVAAADMVARDDDAPRARKLDPEELQKRMAERHARHMELRQQRLDKLKTELKITKDQEAAWSAFVARTTPDTKAMQERMTQRLEKREDWSKLSTPERLDQMAKRKAERDAEMTKHMDAVKSLYAALTPEQQKTFDQQSLRMMGPMGGGMGGGMGMEGRHGHHGGHHGGKGMMGRGMDDRGGERHAQRGDDMMGRHGDQHRRHGMRDDDDRFERGGRMGPGGECPAFEKEAPKSPSSLKAQPDKAEASS